MRVDQTVRLNNLLYGCLYHFMGHNNIVSSMCLNNYKGKKEWNDIANSLSEYIKKENDYNSLKTIQKKVNADTSYLDELSEAHRLSGKIINAKKYFDEKKYPRKFYRYKIADFTDKKIRTVLLPAIFLYLLRSHCSSWAIKPVNDSMITDSKEALNDLLQADSLLQNLLFDLQVKKNKENAELLYSSDNLTVKSPKAITMNFSSLLIILRCIINIFKGNIYKNINFVENALDSYCSALRLYEEQIKIEDELNDNIKHGNLLCPTIGKCYFEVSKLLFDRGKKIDALAYELDSIIHLITLSYVQFDKKESTDQEILNIFKNLVTAKKNLDKIRHVSGDSVRKDLILSVFVAPQKIKKIYEYTNSIDANGPILPILFDNNIPLVSPESLKRFTDIIPNELKPIVSSTIADIMARMGFVLYTIRETIQLERCPSEFQEVKEKRETVEEQNRAILDGIKEYFSGFDGYESELGNYTRAFIYPSDSANEFFSRKIERLFSYTFKGIAAEEGEDIERFSNKFLKRSLITAGHLSSIPVRMSHYLLQEGYKERTKKPSFGRKPLNKLVVLRRWQSFNPKVPRPKGQDIRGGGYFLFWKGRGIVIDPGYNFIHNFYEEGFSLEDIHAIVVTHSHPDHDNEMNTILSLLAEWNQMQEMQISSHPEPKHIDLFLNEGAYRKYNSWLYAKKIMVKKIYLLQGGRWDRTTKTYRGGQERSDANPVIDLKSTYGLEMEVLPAWHDELIDKHSSIGLILHLYKNEDGANPQLKIGFTGDTENYDGIGSNYEEVDILVAHLGDVKFRELLSYSKDADSYIGDFVRKWLKIGGLPKLDLLDKLRNYLIHQDIFGLDEEYLRDNVKEKTKEKQLKELRDCKADTQRDIEKIADFVKFYSVPNKDFKYKNHLGLKGLFDLHESMTTRGSKTHTKIMIIGELPEELQSYRHIVACILDEHKGKNKVRHLTGDIGLTIGLPTENIKFGNPGKNSHPFFAVRCMRCNQNNEYIKGIPRQNNTIYYLPHYHPAERIQEIPLKASNSRIAWFCLEHHASHPDYSKHDYYIDPDLRSVWR